MGVENRIFTAPTEVRTSNYHARSDSLYSLRYPGPILVRIIHNIEFSQGPTRASVFSFQMFAHEYNSIIMTKVSDYNNHMNVSQLYIQERGSSWIFVSEIGYPKM
jgi:hypothetical protein